MHLQQVIVSDVDTTVRDKPFHFLQARPEVLPLENTVEVEAIRLHVVHEILR